MHPDTVLSNKVPEITAIFWAIKVMSTTVGETGADYLSVNVGLGTAATGVIMTLLLGAALAAQMRARRYVPWLYWLTVVLVSVVGTQLTDALTDRLDVRLEVSTISFALGLIATFGVWYSVEGTLSIRAVDSRRREAFYWLAILFTFALGTAAGDYVTEAYGLGFPLGVLIFSGLIALAGLTRYLGATSVFTFWVAYVLTRPLGASLGDLLSQSREYGGLGLGNVYTSLGFLAAIIAMVWFVTFKREPDPVRLTS